ncbi:MAG: fumarylacetoacetate hydrolase family protein [Gammaproteobacteria bacterium]
MRLASLKSPNRDGRLLVVSRDLARAVEVVHIAPTLQSALDQWSDIAPLLENVAAQLEDEKLPGARQFDPREVASPLPRAFQFLDGSVYLHHMMKARQARGVEMPPNFDTEPLMYQGVSDSFFGPHEDVPFSSEDLEIDFEAEIAIVTDDVPMGVSPVDAARHIKLIMLMNDWTARALTRSELPKGFGFVQSKPPCSFSPVAVTPDEFGAAWDGAKLSRPLLSFVNGRVVGTPNAGADMFFTYPELIAHAARTRRLAAGTVIGAGAVSNRDPATGHGCIAEARVDEQAAHGAPRTPWLRFGDRVRIDMQDPTGLSVCGALEQSVVKAS